MHYLLNLLNLNSDAKYRFERGIDPNSIEEGLINVSRKNDDSESKSMHGTMRQLINNAVEGVSNGFSKHLEILGVGYNVKSQGSRLVFQLGFSHDIMLELPDGIEADATR